MTEDLKLIWLTKEHWHTRHAVFHGEGKYTEFWCGQEDYMGGLRKPKGTDRDCLNCLAAIGRYKNAKRRQQR